MATELEAVGDASGARVISSTNQATAHNVLDGNLESCWQSAGNPSHWIEVALPSSIVSIRTAELYLDEVCMSLQGFTRGRA